MSAARGRAACNGCRSRKQKCDETRPVCSRCSTLGRRCTWPVSRKRGPAKGYTEALESRLSETEAALIHLWQVLTDESLNSAFNSNDTSLGAIPIMPRLDSGSEKATRIGTDKSVLVRQWETFPLDSVSGIEKWALHVKGATKPSQRTMSQEVLMPNCHSPQQGLPTGSPTVQRGRKENCLQSNPSAPAMSAVVSETASAVWTPGPRSVQNETSAWFDNPTRGRNTQQESSRTTQLHSPSSGDSSKIILTEEFQAQYVW